MNIHDKLPAPCVEPPGQSTLHDSNYEERFSPVYNRDRQFRRALVKYLRRLDGLSEVDLRTALAIYCAVRDGACGMRFHGKRRDISEEWEHIRDCYVHWSIRKIYDMQDDCWADPIAAIFDKYPPTPRRKGRH